MSIPTKNVTVDVFDPTTSAPIVGATVTAQLTATDVYQKQTVARDVISTVTDAAGHAVLALFPNTLGEKGTAYQFKVVHPTNGSTILRTVASVPNENVALSDIAGNVGTAAPLLPNLGQQIAAAMGFLAIATVIGGSEELFILQGGEAKRASLALPWTFGRVSEGPILAPDGTAAAPAYSFVNAPNYGLTYVGADASVYMNIAGVRRQKFSAGALVLHGSDSLSWTGVAADATQDVRLFRDAANTLALRNGANAQAFNIYNTYTDASNYERAEISWNSNVFGIIGGAAAGTGITTRSMRIGPQGQGDLNFWLNAGDRWKFSGATAALLAVADNTYDIGASGAGRPRTGYFGTSVAIGSAVSAAILGLGYDSAATNGIRLKDTNATGNEWLLGPGVGSGTRGDFNLEDVTTSGRRLAIVKTTGQWNIFTAGGEQFQVSNVASAVNYVEVFGAVTGSGVNVNSNGSDAAVNLNLTAKGAGVINFNTSGGSATQFKVAHTASAVNYIQVSGAAAAGGVTISAQGSDSNITLAYSAKGGNGHDFYTNAFGSLQLSILHTASANRSITLTGSNGGNPTIGVSAGSLNISSKVAVGTNSDPGWDTYGVIGVGSSVGMSASLANYSPTQDLRLTTNGYYVSPNWKYVASAAAAQILMDGGAPTFTFQTAASGTAGNNITWLEQVRITHTASATRYITLTGSNGGNPTIGVSAGALAVTPNIVCASAVIGYAATTIPAGGTIGTGFLFSSTGNFGTFFGSGAPTLSAAKGSLYLRSDGTTTNNRAYINTDGGTTWTALTTVA